MAAEVVASAKVFLACEQDVSRILLLEGAYDLPGDTPAYDLPGGVLMSGESGLDAVTRGTYEETALQLDPSRLVRFFTSTELPRYTPHDQPHQALGRLVVREFFLGKLREPYDVDVSNGYTGGYWTPRERLLMLSGVKVQHKSAYQRVENYGLWELVDGYAG